MSLDWFPFRRRTRQVLLAFGVLAVGLAVAILVLRHRTVVRTLQLSDGTRAYFRTDTRVTAVTTFPNPRLLRVDGELLLTTDKLPMSEPLIIESRLLKLTVSDGATVRLTAYSHQSGEQVDVLAGHVVAAKAYPSNHPEPEVLDGGEMAMVNKDIDLMEKEKADVRELRAWSIRTLRESRTH